MQMKRNALMDKDNLAYGAMLITKLLEFTGCTPFYRVSVNKDSTITVRESTTNIPDARAQTEIQKFKNAMRNLNDHECMAIREVMVKLDNTEKVIEIRALQITKVNKKNLNDYLVELKNGVDNVSDSAWESVCTKDNPSMHQP